MYTRGSCAELHSSIQFQSSQILYNNNMIYEFMMVLGRRVQERVRRARGSIFAGKFDEGKYVLLILILYKLHLTSGFFYSAFVYVRICIK
jgi:hypothetical protein